MRTAIVYYSRHHGNTKKLVKAIAQAHEVTLINAKKVPETLDMSEFDRIGFASGIYYSSYAKELLTFAENSLPEGKDVFFIDTCGALRGNYLDAIRRIAKEKMCRELGAYQCRGLDTYGPFRLVGGIAKGHPSQEEILKCVEFYESLDERAAMDPAYRPST